MHNELPLQLAIIVHCNNLTSECKSRKTMASEQCVKNEELELNFEEKATLDELVKEAECQLTENTMNEGSFRCDYGHGELSQSSGGGTQSGVTALAGALKNMSKGPMTLFAQNKWGGRYLKNPPQTLNNTGAFMQTALGSNGCKAAVVYAGKNKSGTQCGWLLAWHNARGSVRKVYVECGPKSKFNNIKWDQIEKKLDKNGSSDSFVDKSTGSKAYAAINGTTGKSALGAGFSG